MIETEPQFLTVGEGTRQRRIATRSALPRQPETPGLLWLAGLKSDMASTKATALAEWALDRGLGMTRFDYSGHGLSEGRFEEATIGDWLEEARAVFACASPGQRILVGSSTGGYIALLLLRAFLAEDLDAAARITALVLIAPAWDLTEDLMWRKYPQAARQAILEHGVYRQPSAYGEPYVITRNFIEEGRRHLLGGATFDPGRPVVILQGALDPDVPLGHSEKLAGLLSGGWPELIVVADGDHRLSRPEDLDLLFRTLARFTGPK